MEMFYRKRLEHLFNAVILSKDINQKSCLPQIPLIANFLNKSPGCEGNFIH